MRLYLDTNVLLSFWLDEIENYNYPSHYALQLRERALDCEFTFVVSSVNLLEIENKYPFLIEDFKKEAQLMKRLEKLKFVSPNPEDDQFSIKLLNEFRHKGAHSKDMQHLALAIRHADALVTMDKNLQRCAEPLIPAPTPAQLLGLS